MILSAEERLNAGNIPCFLASLRLHESMIAQRCVFARRTTFRFFSSYAYIYCLADCSSTCVNCPSGRSGTGATRKPTAVVFEACYDCPAGVASSSCSHFCLPAECCTPTACSVYCSDCPAGNVCLGGQAMTACGEEPLRQVAHATLMPVAQNVLFRLSLLKPRLWQFLCWELVQPGKALLELRVALSASIEHLRLMPVSSVFQTACPAGSFTAGSTTAASCTTCPMGSYCPAGACTAVRPRRVSVLARCLFLLCCCCCCRHLAQLERTGRTRVEAPPVAQATALQENTAPQPV